MAAPFSLIAFLISISTLFTVSESFDFLYNGFNRSNLNLQGATVIRPSGALKLTNRSHDAIGHAFYPTPLPFLNSTSHNNNVVSFSTYFVFAIIPLGTNRGGYGFGFTLSPSMKFPGAQGDHYLGVFNSSNDGQESNHVFMVEFDTVNGHNEGKDDDGNHIGININGMGSVASQPAVYYINGTRKTEEVKLQSGEPIQAWVDYDGVNETVKITVSPIHVPKPSRPLMSEQIKLSSVMKNQMYAGFSAATGENLASSHYILGWSFRLNGPAPPLNLSQLPIPPPENQKSAGKTKLKKALIATFCSLSFLAMAAWVFLALYKRVRHFEALEDWELDCPHRFRYKDLYTATRGFRDNELIGVGGFGTVYKGVIPTNGVQIAVKKINKNSLQGVREFVAEIESLGRLRHKNLVNLQGWCKNKNDLLLVYDYVPNGSLDSLLYRPKTNNNNVVLTWEQRFNIVKGVAAGLLYLHEEWEQVVVHRDIKSSNVLIDGDMNARLGDFGLARLYDHGRNSHTTNVVGTIGYLAPELTRTGKASTGSDVFAYGVLLLEVATGRPPVIYSSKDHGHMALGDWVVECFQRGRILDAVDPKLIRCGYVIEEAVLVLGLGLLCSHSQPEARPAMREVMRYLNGDEDFGIEKALGSLGSRRVDEITSKFLGVFSTGTTTTTASSYRHSSSIGQISTSSFEDGR
ncbi:PREDICTED: lectin-domain containing receptor kinase VI.3-like [Ipomoea nil]|uniref:lectin-domain containing receptor kinase VI.3-like n=1 Tax=Ipomoea nil TaxID=35883 RepID=UPI000900CA58|nr:PREDICTED: lectin-domain containing receptor kinase VI.3-like [Ipomoea nil]